MPRKTQIWFLIAAVGLIASLSGRNSAQADPGMPVAVRWWGNSTASIETYWNLRIIIDPQSKMIGDANPNVSGDLVLVTHGDADRRDKDVAEASPTLVRALDSNGHVRLLHHVLDRLPNETAPTWKESRPEVPRSVHAVVVTSIPSWRDDHGGQLRGASAMLLIEVDGVRIVHCGGLGQHSLTNDQLSSIGRVDVLLILVDVKESVDGPAAARIVQQLKPRIVVPIHNVTPGPKTEPESVEPFVGSLAPGYQVVRAVGNTLAVRQADRRTDEAPKVFLLRHEPWKMPEELATLISRKEAACSASQAVFAKLSIEQMNFRPSNGTHTPRWNAEHMMGRELGFFSQIFSKVDSAVPHIDLNPKQMPPDYIAAHPDWSGAEEARQMERVTALTRRFAYLLDGLDLDVKAPGSRWTLRGLLQQMERHYNEHTENVQKKFALPDWPTQ